MPYLDALVPVQEDPQDLLQRVREMRFRDGGTTVNLGPLDEATVNLIRRVLRDHDRDLVLALPEGRHDLAVALGVLLQLNRLGARMNNRTDGEAFDGPLVVVGLNTNLTDRLRRLKLGAQSLSQALSAQRVRSDGTVTDLRGIISPARSWGQGLLYLNTSLGWPLLRDVRPGLVIVDRTSFRNPGTLDAALAWARLHQTERVIVLGTVGEAWPPPLQDTERWLRWAWTPGLRRDVCDELGHPRDCGPLSTNALLCETRRPVLLAEYVAPELTRLRRSSMRGIAAARRANQPFPAKLVSAVQLANLLAGSWGRLDTADRYAVLEPRGQSISTLRRQLGERRDSDLPREWAGFRETHWADLRRDILDLAELLEEYNPRLEVLQGILAWAEAHRPNAPVIVRTQTRYAARALLEDLLHADPALESRLDDTAGPARLSVRSYSDRLTWACGHGIGVHLGVPPPWRRANLMGGEATEHLLVVDPDEKAWASRVLREMDQEWQSVLDSTADALGFDRPPGPQLPQPRSVYGPVHVDDRGDDSLDEPVAVPSIDLDGLFAAFSSAVANTEPTEEDSDTSADSGAGTAIARSVLARPFTLEPGDQVYWLPSEATAEVLVGSRYSSTQVTALTAGMTLLIPRGETRDELYGRLVQAAHQDAEVMAVTMVLKRFRRATRELYNKCGTWDEVARELGRRGSQVKSGQTCRNWAEGTVIAPEDVTDIRRVAWLTDRHDLTIDRTWERMGAIADELRRLHRELGRLLSGAIAEAASGRAGEHVRRLSELCGGIDPAEVLEEFELRRIQAVGAPRSVPSNRLRRVMSLPSTT